MKKRVLSVMALIVLAGLLSGCCLQHQWVDATCTSPRTCAACGKTEGSPIEHSFEEPTCTRPRTCAACGAIEGEALGHVWMRTTCTEPKTCSVCGAIDGDPMEHTWIAATCVAPKHCAVCGLVEGDKVSHQWMPANYNSPRMCSVCGATEGSPIESFVSGGENSFNYSLSTGTKQNYSTITGYDNRIANGTVTVLSYNKFASDSSHPAKEGYEWREVKVMFSMDKPCRVMWGYTDVYTGLSEYARTDYITYADGRREKVDATQSFSSEVVNTPSSATPMPTPTQAPEPTQAPQSDSGNSSGSPAPPTAPQITPSPTPTPIPTPESEPDKYLSYVTQTVQVPIRYDGLIFYVCNADYENDHRVDDSFQFMKMY